MDKIRYLQVTHIPFYRKPNGNILLDEVWARDIQSLANQFGSIRVTAPELTQESDLRTWGPTAIELEANSNIEFAGFPVISSPREFWKWPAIRRVLKGEVQKADIVHSSNWFPPYLILYDAHHLASRMGKKTVFVIAEDFYDMLQWEWVRTASSSFQRWRRQRSLDKMERKVREAASTASLTFLHTPSVVSRYRCDARNGTAIRLPTHEKEDVINEKDLQKKMDYILEGEPLIISAACRHKPLKGLDYLIRAVAELKNRHIPLKAHIYGEGSSTPELKQLAIDLGVSERITFFGSSPPGTLLYRALGKTHLFAMPHVTHDFGRTFFDALTGGTPVVAFRTPASVETVRDGIDGLLVPLENTLAFSLAIEWCHHHRAQLAAMVKEARARALIETKSTWQRYRSERIKELF